MLQAPCQESSKGFDPFVMRDVAHAAAAFYRPGDKLSAHAKNGVILAQ
jgi:hypothetical protein